MGADAGVAQAVDDRLADIGKGGIAIEWAGIEAAGMAGLGEQLLRRGDVVDRRGRLPVKLEMRRDKAVSVKPRMAEGDCVIDALAVDRQVHGAAHPDFRPRRFWVPLFGEIDPEWRGVAYREGEPRRALHVLG